MYHDPLAPHRINHGLSSPYGYGWYCLPPPRKPSELSRSTPNGSDPDASTPTLVWVPLLVAADRLKLHPNTLYARVKKGLLECQRQYAPSADGRRVLGIYLREDQLRPRLRKRTRSAG